MRRFGCGCEVVLGDQVAKERLEVHEPAADLSAKNPVQASGQNGGTQKARAGQVRQLLDEDLGDLLGRVAVRVERGDYRPNRDACDRANENERVFERLEEAAVVNASHGSAAEHHLFLLLPGRLLHCGNSRQTGIIACHGKNLSAVRGERPSAGTGDGAWDRRAAICTDRGIAVLIGAQAGHRNSGLSYGTVRVTNRSQRLRMIMAVKAEVVTAEAGVSRMKCWWKSTSRR